jgi:hypothetical protein
VLGVGVDLDLDLYWDFLCGWGGLMEFIMGW